MNRQSIHQQIDSLLKIIRDQHEQLKIHTGSIPQVELDFMVQNLRQLYEAALLLNHTNALTSLDEVKAAVTLKILAEKRSLEIQRTETPVKEKEEMAMEQVPENAAGSASAIQSKTGIIVNDAPIVPAREEKKEKTSRNKSSNDVNTLFEDTPTVGDKFGTEESLHRKIAARTSSKTLADKLHRNPIKDLKSAIGINEKFLFVNKLFEGNLQNYSAAVEKLNSVNDLGAARQVAAEISGQLNWNDSDEHVKNFMELVERRFS